MSEPAAVEASAAQGPASRQRGRLEHGAIKRTLKAGAPVRTLRTLYRISVHTSGNPDGVKMRTGVLARNTGVSVRTTQRDLHELEGRAPGLEVKRSRVKGERAKSHPSTFKLPQVSFEAPGVPLWAELTTKSEWTGATATQQGLLVYLMDAVGYSGRLLSFNQIVREANVSRTTARTACYYWRNVGWLEMEAQNTPDEGSLANFMRVRLPWEAAPPTAHLPDAKRRERALAPVARWSGLELAERERVEGGWWARVARALDERDSAATTEVTDMLTRYLNGPARRCGYKSSGRTRDVLAVLPTVWARRDGYDREVAEAIASAQDEPVRPPDRRWGEPWYGDWKPEQPEQPELTTWEPDRWDAVVDAATRGDHVGDFDRLQTTFWRAQVRPYKVVDGALVLVVENPALGDMLARAWVAAIARAVGGPVALRLASQHRHVEAGEAHGQLKTLAPRLAAAGERLDGVARALEALPPMEVHVIGERKPEADWRFERFIARGKVKDNLGELQKALKPLVDALTWTRESSSPEPDWRDLLVRARKLLDEGLPALVAAMEHAQQLGGMPAGKGARP